MRFAYECPLRWSDMDAYGHLNNSRFLTLYEEARAALARASSLLAASNLPADVALLKLVQ